MKFELVGLEPKEYREAWDTLDCLLIAQNIENPVLITSCITEFFIQTDVSVYSEVSFIVQSTNLQIVVVSHYFFKCYKNAHDKVVEKLL